MFVYLSVYPITTVIIFIIYHHHNYLKYVIALCISISFPLLDWEEKDLNGQVDETNNIPYEANKLQELRLRRKEPAAKKKEFLERFY